MFTCYNIVKGCILIRCYEMHLEFLLQYIIHLPAIILQRTNENYNIVMYY